MPDVQRQVYAGSREHGHLARLFTSADVRRLRLRPRQRGNPPRILAAGRDPVTAFDDPFRARLLREILDSAHQVALLHQEADDPTPEHDLFRQGSRVRGPLTLPLNAMGEGMGHANGVTIISPNLMAAIPNYTGPVSRRANRSYIVYVDPLSLAHELFGHLYLALRGSQATHRRDVTAGRGVQDPAGGEFAGSVNEFISQYASEVRLGLGGVHLSPTVRRSWPIPGQETPFVGSYIELRRRYPGAHVRAIGRRIQVVMSAPRERSGAER